METPLADGGKRFIKVGASPIHDLDGNLLGIITLATDLTSSIKAQTLAMEAQRDKIASAAKADAIADRLSTAAEELAAQIEESSRGPRIRRSAWARRPRPWSR